MLQHIFVIIALFYDRTVRIPAKMLVGRGLGCASHPGGCGRNLWRRVTLSGVEGDAPVLSCFDSAQHDTIANSLMSVIPVKTGIQSLRK